MLAAWNMPAIERAGLVGQHEGVLRRQGVAVAPPVVADVAGRGLRVEPLAHVAVVRARARGDLGGAARLSVGHRAVEPQLVTDRHQRGAERRPEVRGHLAYERLHAALVDRRAHRVLLGLGIPS
jgi:hypothetical protein